MQNISPRCCKILPLPEEVAAQITSSTAIPSLTSVVIGLLENSLDAGASKVDINVDFVRAACTIEDDGYGIEPKEFTEEGGLGKRFYTSKYNNREYLYGGQGTFLSSVAALSILSVTSRQHRRISQSSLVLHHSRPAARFLKAPAHHSLSIRGHGTRVVVHDLFGSMPVRVKQRNKSSSKGTKSDTKDFEHLKKAITALLLSFHRPVHICLHQTEGEGEGAGRKLHIGVKPESSSAVEDDRSTTSIDVPLLSKILTHAGYIEPSKWDTWVKTTAQTSKLRIRGAISLQPSPSKSVQFMSLGNRPLDPESGHNTLYEEVNKLFGLSSFGNEEEVSDTEDAKRSKDRRYKQDGFTNRQLRGRGKGVDRWPMFYIRVDLGGQNDTKKLEREATLNDVIKVLGAMIHRFLSDNHFRPRASARMTRLIPGSLKKTPNLKRVLTSEDSFSKWSRIKSSNRHTSYSKNALEKITHESASPVVGSGTMDPIQGQKVVQVNDAGEDLIEWTNPISKAMVLINSRTGLVIARQASESRPATAPAELQRPDTAPRITRPNSRGFITPQKGSWADNFLSTWENPVFAPPMEERIPQATFNSPSLDTLHTRCSHSSDADITGALAQSLFILSTRLSKTDLQSAHVIAQVDKKFILISINSTNTSNLLILVDQHAADERIRFESLLDDLHSQPPVPVTKPLIFEIPKREYDLFTSYSPFFTHWGITYTLFTPPTTRLAIHTLPPTIATRCHLEPKLLIKLLRTEIWHLHSSSSPPSYSTPPQGIIDMLSSRACRSAIMFNDVLTLEEARALVQMLARTRMPWQCAHGRPSMVPLIEVGAADAGQGSNGGEKGTLGLGLGLVGGGTNWREVDGDGGHGSNPVPFVEAWKGWKGGMSNRSE